MAQRPNAAGFTKETPFYGAPDLEVFKERLRKAIEYQKEILRKAPKMDGWADEEIKAWEEKKLPFLKTWNKFKIYEQFTLLRLGPPVSAYELRYKQIYDRLSDELMIEYQRVRKERRKKKEEKQQKEREKKKKPKEPGKPEEPGKPKELEKPGKPDEKKPKPRWLYWMAREQDAKRREHEQYLDAGKTALALGRAIRKIQQKIMAFVAPLIEYAATLKTPEARLIWSKEPWTPQERTQYNWGKKQELAELWEQFPDGFASQDVEKAKKDAKKKTKARQIDHAKAIDKVLDQLIRELAEDEKNAVTSSLERSYKQVYTDILRELEESRRAIDADKSGETRIADARDYTNRRRTAPETQIPRNMPKFGNYGESVIFGAPSPDQIKAVLNAKFNGRDYSERIWKDRDKLASELKEMMAAAIINGENSRIVAQKLAQRMGVEFSHAQRLIRTEQNRILNESIVNSAKDAGIRKYRFIAIVDERTCGRCRKKNGKIYKITEKKVGENFPPLHPHCRCTVAGVPMWEDDENGNQTPDPPDSQKTIEGWLKEVEAIDKAKADAVRNSPTQANAQAAADAQDAAMKEAEQRQRMALGIQKRAIQQGKPTKTEKNSPEISNREAQGNMSKVAKRSANRTTGDRNADRKTTTQGDAMREIAQKIKEQYQASRTDEEKALIRELVESGKKCKPENIVLITKSESDGIIWLETGNKKAGLEHIANRHAKDFEARGIKPKDVPKFITEALKKGKIEETITNEQGKTHLLKIEEKQYKIAIGFNGYVVTAYPC